MTECEEDIKKRSGEADAAAESEVLLNEQGERVERLSGAAKSLCIPFDQPGSLKKFGCIRSLAKQTCDFIIFHYVLFTAGIESHMCVGCGKQAVTYCLYGRSY